MKSAADLLSAIATLLWPIFAFIVLFIYRKQVETILDRLKRGKFLGQELELESSRRSETQPLASDVVIENLDALLASPAFAKKIASIVAASSQGGTETVTRDVLKAVQDAASQEVKTAFVQVDTRPLLGRYGKVWEVPYRDQLTVRRFLDDIWVEMNPINRPPHRYQVKPHRYPDGWVLRSKATNRLFTDIGREWAKRNGEPDDERPLKSVGIEPGSMLEVVPGPKAAEAVMLAADD